MTIDNDPKALAAGITRLRKAGKITEAEAQGEAGLKKFPENWSIKNALAWVLYEKLAKAAPEANVEPDVVEHALERLRGLQSHQLYGDLSPYVMTALKLSECLNRDGFHREAVAELRRLDIAELSTQGRRWNGFDVPSQTLKYYTLITKALLDLNDFEDVVVVCNEAIISPAITRNKDKMWFYYRRAQALTDANPAEALKDIDRFLTINTTWQAVRLRAQILARQGDADGSRQEYARALAAVAPNSYHMAISLLAEYAKATDKKSVKEGLIQSVRSIREKNGWKADPGVEAIAQELGLSTASEFDFRAFIAGLGPPALPVSKSANPYPSQEENIVLEPAVGKVRRLLESNTHGFITVDGFGDTYFRGSDNPEMGWPPIEEQKYVGKIVESYDKKKGSMSTKFLEGKPFSS